MIFSFLRKHLANDYVFCDRIFPNYFLPFNVKEEKAASALVYEMNDPLISLSKEKIRQSTKGAIGRFIVDGCLQIKKQLQIFSAAAVSIFFLFPITEKHWGGSVHLWDKA